jgi:predicted CopG family antitoxin
MASKAIKVSENTYNHLKKMSEEKKVSIKEIVERIAEDQNGIKDYRGSWDAIDEEVEEIKRERENLWENWKV